ncbi:Scr1 family TA system antitoxin-like transcriptional regulator [Streptomyces sp. NPDC001046]|uniref:Scr1 family TA system antitoxin-like transcriptional regulator n=1 Tax=Streptomyces sp. NPDC001046 TaxID=3364543 RepID=UPI0036A24D8E
MAEQLDRLYNLVGQTRIELGILPFGTQLRRITPHAFWIYDRRLVVVETISEELWLTEPKTSSSASGPGTGSPSQPNTARQLGA